MATWFFAAGVAVEVVITFLVLERFHSSSQYMVDVPVRTQVEVLSDWVERLRVDRSMLVASRGIVFPNAFFGVLLSNSGQVFIPCLCITNGQKKDEKQQKPEVHEEEHHPKASLGYSTCALKKNNNKKDWVVIMKRKKGKKGKLSDGGLFYAKCVCIAVMANVHVY